MLIESIAWCVAIFAVYEILKGIENIVLRRSLIREHDALRSARVDMARFRKIQYLCSYVLRGWARRPGDLQCRAQKLLDETRAAMGSTMKHGH